MKKLITLFFLLLVGFLVGTQKGGPLHTNPTFADVPGGDGTTGDGTTTVDGVQSGGDSGCGGAGDGDSGCSSGSGCL